LPPGRPVEALDDLDVDRRVRDSGLAQALGQRGPQPRGRSVGAGAQRQPDPQTLALLDDLELPNVGIAAQRRELHGVDGDTAEADYVLRATLELAQPQQLASAPARLRVDRHHVAELEPDQAAGCG